MPKWEVSIFNEEVRAANKMGDKHEQYEDSWGDPHYIEIQAPNEEVARQRIEKQYPSHRGFVVESITEVLPDEDF